MARQKRDYKAERARRDELARQRGFRGYQHYRRATERGEAPFVAPHRIRSKKSRDLWEGFQRFVTPSPDERDLAKRYRIELAQTWSNSRSRHWSLEFDARRASYDEDYLSTYLQAFVIRDLAPAHNGSFTYSPEHQHWFVDIMEYYDAEEYDDHYTND